MTRRGYDAGDDAPLETPIGIGHRWYENRDGLLGGTIGVAAGLVFCSQLVAGATLSGTGFIIGLAVIQAPLIAWVAYLDRPRVRHDPHAARWVSVLFLGFMWLFVGPIVADQLTPDFNIGGFWQYLVLISLIFLFGEISGYVLKAAKRAVVKLR